MKAYSSLAVAGIAAAALILAFVNAAVAGSLLVLAGLLAIHRLDYSPRRRPVALAVPARRRSRLPLAA